MEECIAISDAGISRMAIDIYDYAEKINSILNKIDDLMEASKDCWKINDENAIYARYKYLSNSFDIIKYNISSYADDLLKAKSKYLKFSSNLADDIKQMATNIHSDLI